VDDEESDNTEFDLRLDRDRQRRVELARATSSNDIFALGRLFGGEVARTVVIGCIHGRRPRGLQPCLKPRADLVEFTRRPRTCLSRA
jgi:hypothetical protein